MSIIIPVNSVSSLLYEFIFSLRNQTSGNWECILVDDSPDINDISLLNQICDQDHRIKYFKRPDYHPKGSNSCRNYGFLKSKGDYIQWFDSDDIMHPEFLEKKVKLLSETKADFVVCKGSIFEGKIKNVIGKWDSLSGLAPAIDQALGRINFQTNAPMFRKEFLEGKKLWNEKLQRKQDYEFFNRILSHSSNYKVVDECLFFYRQHSKSINGINSPTTISSMILADLLVYNNTVRTIKEKKEKLQFQQHFFRKIIFRSKIASRNRLYLTYLRGLWGALSIINLDYIKYYFQKK